MVVCIQISLANVKFVAKRHTILVPAISNNFPFHWRLGDSEIVMAQMKENAAYLCYKRKYSVTK